MLAVKVRKTLSSVRKDGVPLDSVLSASEFNFSTRRMLREYLHLIEKDRQGLLYKDVFKSPFDGFCADADDCQPTYPSSR